MNFNTANFKQLSFSVPKKRRSFQKDSGENNYIGYLFLSALLDHPLSIFQLVIIPTFPFLNTQLRNTSSVPRTQVPVLCTYSLFNTRDKTQYGQATNKTFSYIPQTISQIFLNLILYFLLRLNTNIYRCFQHFCFNI